MFEKIPGTVREDFGECSSTFWGMFKIFPGILNVDLFREIFLIFYQILQLNCDKTKL